MCKSFLCGVLCILFAAQIYRGAAQAETIKSVSAGTTYDSNVYGSHAGETDAISELEVYLAYRSPGERSETEYYYTGSGVVFLRSGATTHTTNSLGFVYARNMGTGRSGLSAGGSFSLRTNRAYYDTYNYASLQGAVNGRWYIRHSLLLRSSYRLRWRNYWNSDPFSYTEHYLSAQIDKFLPSRTALRADISYGHKDHPSAVAETVQFGPFRRRWNNAPSPTLEPDVPDEGQVVLGVQVTHSLADHTGLRLRYQARLNTTSERYDLSRAGVDYYWDEDIFTDRYDHNGHRWSIRLTQELPARARVVLGGGYETRRYNGRSALDLSGLPVASGAFRKDRTVFASLSAQKPVTPAVSIGLWYEFERNRSNDPYYDYNGRHTLSLEFKVDF